MKIQIISLIVFGIITSGCSYGTLADVISDHAKGKGKSQIYSVDSNQAWDIAKVILRQWMGADAIEEHKEEGYLLASAGPISTFLCDSDGGVIGIWIGHIDKNNTRVTAISRRKHPFDTYYPLSRDEFFVRFNQAVEIIKNGKILPITPPPRPTNFDPANPD